MPEIMTGRQLADERINMQGQGWAVESQNRSVGQKVYYRKPDGIIIPIKLPYDEYHWPRYRNRGFVPVSDDVAVAELARPAVPLTHIGDQTEPVPLDNIPEPTFAPEFTHVFLPQLLEEHATSSTTTTSTNLDYTTDANTPIIGPVEEHSHRYNRALGSPCKQPGCLLVRTTEYKKRG